MRELPIDVLPVLASETPYTPNRHPAPTALKLDRNEAGPPPPEVCTALAADRDRLRRYTSAEELERALAERLWVDPGAVLVTAGADDALERAIRAVAGPGRRVVVTDPTFEMITRFARYAGAEVAAVPWWSEPFPVDDVISWIDDATAAVVVVSPNNPTGSVVTEAELDRLARACGRRMLLLDHAYAEFADRDLTRAALRHRNVVVTRTLSKAWGLAGLRVGYAVGDRSVIGVLRCLGQPCPVSVSSLAAAQAAVADGRYSRTAADAVRRRRNQLGGILANRGAEVVPSQANFVLAGFPVGDWVRDGLAGMGISVRSFPGRPDLRGWVRITVPESDADLHTLQRALDTVLRPEALLLDMDGVLADVSRSYRGAMQATGRRFGVELDEDEIVAAKLEGDANNDWVLTRRLLARRGVDVPLESVVETFQAVYEGDGGRDGLRDQERLIPDRALLERLADGRPLAVVTGRPRAEAERFLDRFGLGELIPVAVAMGETPAKPDPAPVRTALERLGVRRAWMVGDTVDDVRAARAAGVLPIGVVAPGDPRDQVAPALLGAGAARVLDDLDQIVEVM